MNEAAFLLAEPQTPEAEQAVLGSLLIAPEFVAAAAEKLAAADFYLPKHRTIWLALVDMERCSLPIDLLSVTEELRNQEQIDCIGGVAYLIQLQDSVPTALHWEHYAHLVRDKAVRRNLIHASIDIHTWARDEEQEPAGILDRSEEAIFALARDPRRGAVRSMRAVAFEELDRLDRAVEIGQNVNGTPSGLASLDEMTQGFQAGDMILLAGRPGTGKTALAHACALNAAAQGFATLIFSLEMSEGQVVQRMISSEARVNSLRLRSGMLCAVGWGGEHEHVNITRAVGRIGDLPLYVDDSSLVTTLEIRARARRLAKEVPLGFIIIDYLQLIRGDGGHRSRVQEVGEIAHALKGLARELHVPVLALSQLSRNVEHREDKRPMLSDLRESGDLESDADLVLMLYRASYYERHDPGSPDPADAIDPVELLIAKHRNGPVGTVKLGFLRRYVRFEELTEGWRTPSPTHG